MGYILVIDDAPDIQQVLGFMLKKKNHLVKTAGTVQQGLQFFQEETPILTFVDYHLPDGLGSDVLKVIKAKDVSLPVILLSGQDSVDSSQMGFDDFIAKEAGDGLQAIAIVAENFATVGLILCDWNMPNMNGLEFIEGIAKVPTVAHIPVIMVTTEGTAEKIAQAKAANPNLVGYVTKPFTPDQLKAAIEPIVTTMG